MKNLKLILIAFIAGFTIFFNIERLDFAQENLIDISSFIYVLAVIAIITTLIVPVLERASLPNLIAFWILMYWLGKTVVFLFSGRPLFGGIYTYLSITELTLFLILISLTHWLILALNRFETSIENIAFANLSNRVRQMNEAAEDIQIEMFRSRHNHHPLSVVIVEPDSRSIQEVLSTSLKEVRQLILNSYVVNRMSSTLSKYLRRTDMILAQPDQNVFFGCA